jgi:YHS domain-containing protein
MVFVSIRYRRNNMRFATTILAAAFVAVALPVSAGKPVKPAKPAKVALKCPVTHETIAKVDKANGKSVYKGKTYYFCCKACKAPFDANPEKYLKKK